MTNNNYIVGEPRIDQMIQELSKSCTAPECQVLIKEMLTTLMKFSQEHSDVGDYKLINTSLKELRHGLKTFLPYRHKLKAVIFGSARTGEKDPCYQMTQNLSEQLSRNGIMVISGAGGGIMEAANRGAGPENTFGINIKLPFEQQPNPYIRGNQKLMSLKYFFTRKLLFIKESNATILFPGGFGTLDEGFENMTLLQTGKSLPRPIVLAEPENGVFWENWLHHIKTDLLGNGYISEDDLKLFYISRTVDEAVKYILEFFRVYHSLRYVKELTVLRFTQEIPKTLIDRLNGEFKDIIRDGTIQSSPPLQEELLKKEFPDTPRLVFNFNKRDFGRLMDLIHYINRYA
jgi:uncharacterized protein (TIGR00730 family)